MSVTPSYDVSDLTARRADLSKPSDAGAVLRLLEAYAEDPMGIGGPLPPEVRAQVLDGLQKTPNALVFLAHGRLAKASAEVALGAAVCFTAYSTFRAGPLVNIHDLIVLREARGLGVGKLLLETVEAEARRLGCVRVTLEVLSRNQRAQSVYVAAGFAPSMEFWTKELPRSPG